LLEVNRTSVYYKPAEPDRDLENMIKNRIDYWHTKMPYLGVRKLRDKLQKEDHLPAGRKLIKRYMDEMGIYAMCPSVQSPTFQKETSSIRYIRTYFETLILNGRTRCGRSTLRI
jgi:hypothetical protein